MPSAPIVSMQMPMSMPMHMGMGMGSIPMAFGTNNIPPLEALPLPLTIEEFEQEQAIQRELKKAYGDNYFRAPGMAYRGIGGYRGSGYRGPPSQWRPGGGRGITLLPHTYIHDTYTLTYTHHITHTNTYTHTCIHTYTHIHTHTYT